MLIIKDGKHYGVECKRVGVLRLTASKRAALKDLQLKIIAVIYPGLLRYPLAERITAVPLQVIAKLTDDPSILFRQKDSG